MATDTTSSTTSKAGDDTSSSASKSDKVPTRAEAAGVDAAREGDAVYDAPTPHGPDADGQWRSR